ncbi:hypothetical protein [uncultured Marixanthomonas sp.]|uniref:hypothetical protein n=1 Tax=uncultured Marixanthomonas sp. TaxID=757245 RepID=UPI0030D7D803|tara:strand:+ start:9314 stop:10156 length:843 start_codon:yes stop_codon:yes gene_type:complete
MKKLFTKSFFFTITLFILTTSIVSAQSDIILKTNGEEMVGTVNAVENDDFKFIYKNETVQYTVPKKDVAKITFSSGRIQFVNNAQDIKKTVSNTENRHNKVAVLPFAYIKNQEGGSSAMTEKIQRETFSIFKGKALTLKYQDVNTTNTLLAKAGVKNDNVNSFTMGELCNILSVEYLIQGTVSVEKTGTSTYSSTTANSKQKGKVGTDKIGNIWGVAKSNASASTYGKSTDDYATTINMNIYNDHGDNIFSQDHDSFWQTEDAYKVTLNYLAKRSPLFKK